MNENKPKIEERIFKIQKQHQQTGLKNVDFVYVINLNHRPQKFTNCRTQLETYGISPFRFPAIYGWELSQEFFNDIGTKITPNMHVEGPVYFRPSGWEGPRCWIRELDIGRTCVHFTLVAGALGCYMSHLSVLADAYESGYETIWVLEDDFTVEQNPHLISTFIDQLDTLVGSSEWDVLYTDDDHHHTLDNLMVQLSEKDLPFDPNYLVYPHTQLSPSLAERTPITNNFYKIGGRSQMHSAIIRRSGMEKILNYAKKQGIFRPYDMEIAFVPNIKLYNLNHSIVHGRIRLMPSETNAKPPK